MSLFIFCPNLLAECLSIPVFLFHYPQGTWKEKALTLWGNTVIRKEEGGGSHVWGFFFFARGLKGGEGVLSYSRTIRKYKIVKNGLTFKTTWSGCIVSVWQRRGSRFLLCRALIESTVKHQAGQYEIITPHNGHKTTGSGRTRKRLHSTGFPACISLLRWTAWLREFKKGLIPSYE